MRNSEIVIFLGGDQVQIGGFSFGVLAMVNYLELGFLFGLDGDLGLFRDEAGLFLAG